MAKIREKEDISKLLHLHKEPERSFLRGFSARSNGDYKSALRDYRSAYENNRDYHYARNEYISLKIQVGEADEIAPIAKEEFDKKKNNNNIYVAQAYFNCLLSQFKKFSDPNVVKEIQRVLSSLPNVSDRKLLQMKSCMLAEAAFYIDNDTDKALFILEDCEKEIGEDIYLLFIKESILSSDHKLDRAQEILDRIKEIRITKTAFTDRIAKAQALIHARNGNYPAAEHVCHSGLKYYPQETKNSYLEYLYRVANHKSK